MHESGCGWGLAPPAPARLLIASLLLPASPSLAPRHAAVTARLVNATGVLGRVSGRLELLRQGAWAPVCSSGFNNLAAAVVCKQVRLRRLRPSRRLLHCAVPCCALPACHPHH